MGLLQPLGSLKCKHIQSLVQYCPVCAGAGPGCDDGRPIPIALLWGRDPARWLPQAPLPSQVPAQPPALPVLVPRQFSAVCGPPALVLVLEAGRDTVVQRVLGRKGRQEGGRERVEARVRDYWGITREVVREYSQHCVLVRTGKFNVYVELVFG